MALAVARHRRQRALQPISSAPLSQRGPRSFAVGPATATTAGAAAGSRPSLPSTDCTSGWSMTPSGSLEMLRQLVSVGVDPASITAWSQRSTQLREWAALTLVFFVGAVSTPRLTRVGGSRLPGAVRVGVMVSARRSELRTVAVRLMLL